MNDNDPFEALDSHLSQRMERAVGGLRAPDVVPGAVARGRRHRTHRRLAYGVGGLAASTVLALTVPALATDWPEGEPRSSTPGPAADPATTSPLSTSPTPASPTTTNPGPGGTTDEGCDARTTGWWSKSTAQIKADLAGLLPPGTPTGRTATSVDGEWRGSVVTGEGVGGISITLLPPPGVLGPRRTLEEVSRLGPCVGGANEPFLAVRPCDELTGYVVCDEIRGEDGVLVGVVTEQVEQTVVDGQDQATDTTYVLATIAGPQGGHVELSVGESTRADRSGSAAVPALTVEQVRDIIADPVWSSSSQDRRERAPVQD